MLPQILTTEVIHELMGLPASRAESTSSYSPSSAGARRSRERGYIADRGEDDGGLSESSAGPDADVETDLGLGSPLAAGASRTTASQGLSTRPSFLSVASSGSLKGDAVLKGDATPRARSDRGLEPVKGRELRPEQTSTPPPRVRTPASAKARPSLAQVQSEQAAASGGERKALETLSAPSTSRVPFQSGAELWPHAQVHARAATFSGLKPLSDDDSFEALGASVATLRPTRREVEPEGDDDDDVVELDFSEIGALEDLRAFEARGGASGGRAKGKANMKERGRERAALEQGSPSVSAAATRNGSEAPSQISTPNRDVKAERARKDKEKQPGVIVLQPTQAAPAPAIVTPPSTRNASSLGGSIVTNGSSASSKKPAKKVDALKETPSSPAAFADVSTNVILGEMARSGALKPAMEKNVFIREILTLIHVSAFHDRSTRSNS